LNHDSERLWSKLSAQPINFEQEELPTQKRPARQTKLAVRFCQINRTPYRFDNRDPQQVYAVYASELDCPDGESPVEWMLLTTEVIISDIQRFYAGTPGVLKNTIKFSSQDVRSNIQACG